MNSVDSYPQRPSLCGNEPQGFQGRFDKVGGPHPEFLRLPLPRTRCPITGLSRTTLEELINEGLVPAKRLRRPGRTRCITLIPRRSLIEYVEALPSAAIGDSPAQKVEEALQ